MGDAFLMRHRPKRMKRYKKRLPSLWQSASIAYILFPYIVLPQEILPMLLCTYQPKSAAERASCRCNRKILLSAYLFAMMYPSASEKFLHPSDSSSPDLSCLCRHYSCWETGRTFTSHPLAILVAGLRRFDNLFIKVHFYEQIRHLCYGNACADFIPFWFVFLSKKRTNRCWFYVFFVIRYAWLKEKRKYSSFTVCS